MLNDLTLAEAETEPEPAPEAAAEAVAQVRAAAGTAAAEAETEPEAEAAAETAAQAGAAAGTAAAQADVEPVRTRTRPPRSVWQRADGVRKWFRAFRRTRPFWGGAWMMAGGWVILHYAMAPIQLLVTHGLTSMGGYLFGGGLMACGFIVWLAPKQRFTFGGIGALLAIGSLIGSNLGGFFLGMLVGVVGASMTLGWGDKKPRRRDRERPGGVRR